MRQYHISKIGNYSGGAAGYNDAIRALAQTLGKQAVAVNTPPMIDNGGGVVKNPVPLVAYFADAAVSGSNLAGQASFDASLSAVLNNLATAYSVANAMAAKLGVEVINYQGGGNVSNTGTIGAIPLATASTVGPASAGANLVVSGLNNALYNVLCVARKICIATGDNEPFETLFGVSGTRQPLPSIVGAVAALPTTFGANGAANVPGVSLVAANAALGTWANLLSTIAASLNAAALPGVPKLRAVS